MQDSDRVRIKLLVSGNTRHDGPPLANVASLSSASTGGWHLLWRELQAARGGWHLLWADGGIDSHPGVLVVAWFWLGVSKKATVMLLSIVLPVFNEEEVLPELFKALPSVLERIGWDYELVFVDDGSRDATRRILNEFAEKDHRVKVLGFSRNFGQQAAITAGLDFASGDAVVVMDADLQDPPEMLETMVEQFKLGFDVVSTQRIARDGESYFKKVTANAFYSFMKRAVDERLPPQCGDFRLFSRGAVQALRQFREQHRFMRGLVAWLGLRETIVQFHRPARAAGETKYPAWKLVKLAWTAISSFTAMPLRICLTAGVLLTSIGIAYSSYAIYAALFVKSTAPGWSSLVCFQLIFNGATLTAVGLVGDYVGRIFDEAKQRPLYVIGDSKNISSAGSHARVVWIHPPSASEEGTPQILRLQDRNDKDVRKVKAA
jgi:dolichol-phosphate mannosyltransferase